MTLDGVRAKSGVFNISGETHFDNIPHAKNGIIFENDNNQAAEIDLQDADLKVINNNNDILLITKDKIVSVNGIKNNLDQINAGLANAIIYEKVKNSDGQSYD